MIRWLPLIWLFFVPTLLAAPTRALPTLQMEVYGVDRGLPHNTVLSLAQTPDGFLWIGTWEGLVRFDGARFKPPPASAPAGVRDAGILSLHTAGDGSLWIGTQGGGIYRYHEGRYTVESAPGEPFGAHVLSLLVTRTGQVYAGTSDGQVLRRGPEGFVAIPGLGEMAAGSAYGLAEDREGRVIALSDMALWHLEEAGPVRFKLEWPGVPGLLNRMVPAAGGGLWLATQQGLFRLAADLRTVQPAIYAEATSRVLEDRAGQLWLASEPFGLVRISATGTSALGRDDGLPNSRIASLLTDLEGNLWVGTNRGLLRLSEAAFSGVGERKGLSDPYVRALLELDAGAVLVGGSAGLDLMVGDRVDRRRAWPEALTDTSIMALARGSDGAILVGTTAAGAYAWDGQRLRQWQAPEALGSNQVRAMLTDPDGTFWFGTTRGLSRCHGEHCEILRVSDGLGGEFVTALTRDRDGTLWIGTSLGASRMVDGRLQVIPSGDGERHTVFGFLHDAAGRHWAATDGGLGLLRDGRFAFVGARHGLIGDAVFAVLEDAAGQFWISGNRGVQRIDPAQVIEVLDGRRERVDGRRFGRSDGMPSGQVNGGSQPSAIKTADGRLWFATAGGVAIVDPADPAIEAATPPPHVVVESIEIDGVEQDATQAVVLQPGAQRLSIRYAGVSFVAPHRLVLRYRLAGFEEDWNAAGEDRSASYTNLRPGQYRFEIEALWADGEGTVARTQRAVQVLPAWYQRRPVQVLLLALAMAGLAGIVRLRVAALRRRANELELEVERQTRQLVAERDALALANRRNAELAEQLGRQAREDALTGLANRRRADEALASIEAADQCALMALLDIDHFKAINDRHGHAAGDAVLEGFARALAAHLRSAVLRARIGGEEFLALWQTEDAGQAGPELAALRAAVAPGAGSGQWPAGVDGVRFSGGTAQRRAGEDAESWYRRADRALYRAKAQGRDCVLEG
jgi:diguanylate cyclase (GGDEF)-like protein